MRRMTDPVNRHNIPGKGNYYIQPKTGEMWPAVTSIISAVVAKPALQRWAANCAAHESLNMLPLLVAASRRPVCGAKTADQRCGVCSDCLAIQIADASEVVRDLAADRGSAVHKIAEQMSLGLPVDNDDPTLNNLVYQLLKFWDDFGISLQTDVEMAEASVINRKAGYAGTLDLIVNIKAGHTIRRFAGYEPEPKPGRKTCDEIYVDEPMRPGLWLIDYKTSFTQKDIYPEMGLQLAALANAETVLLDDGDETPMPKRIVGWAICKLYDLPGKGKKPPEMGYLLADMPMAGTKREAFNTFRHCLAEANWLNSHHLAARQPVKPSFITAEKTKEIN